MGIAATAAVVAEVAMGSGQRLGLCGLALLCAACAHLGAAVATPADAPSLLPAGTYDVVALRSRLGGQQVELAPAASEIAGSDGTLHTVSAHGTLALGRDGSCSLMLELRVDGLPGHSVRPCTWHAEGDQVSLVDAAGAATVYRHSRSGGRVLLEAVAETVDGTAAGPAGEDGRRGGESLLLEPQAVSEPLAAQGEPELDAEAGSKVEARDVSERGTRRP